jgi:hypothetical protein
MPVQTIDEVVARMQAVDQSLPTPDGVRWFNRLYLDVTLAVRQYCRSGAITAPPFLEQLDVHFANQYFAAFDAATAGGSVPKCWAPLVEARHDLRIAPLQFAIAGMNAHINHDLALGVVATCQALGLEPVLGCSQHTDYSSVNAILRTTEGQTKQWLLTGAVEVIDHVVAPVADTVAIWSIEAAREAAWARALVLWHLRDHREITSAYLATLDATVGMEGRALLLPRLLHPEAGAGPGAAAAGR